MNILFLMNTNKESDAAQAQQALVAHAGKQLLRGIRKAEASTPTPAASILDPAREKAVVEISDDLEKDINIDVHILNNSASVITHHSNITINYYNVGEPNVTDGKEERALTKHSVYLPRAYLTAIDELKRRLGTDESKLAQSAYRLLLAKHRSKISEVSATSVTARPRSAGARAKSIPAATRVANSS